MKNFGKRPIIAELYIEQSYNSSFFSKKISVRSLFYFPITNETATENLESRQCKSRTNIDINLANLIYPEIPIELTFHNCRHYIWVFQSP